MKMYKFLNEKGGRVILKAIQEPEAEFKSPMEVFKLAFEHERYISKCINDLMDIAIEVKDHSAKSFLNWFVDEQVEEEASMDSLLSKLAMINGDGMGMLMLDKELAIRTFTPPEK
jgi:ferritin